MAANQMKLKTLQQSDPYIIEIIGGADQVAMYAFDSYKNVWSKTETEGTFFIYKRSARPYYGFIVLNRLEPKNPMETIKATLDFHHQGDFLLYRNLEESRDGKAKTIFGIWFFEGGKCTEVKDLLISLVNEVKRTEGSGSRGITSSSTRAAVQPAKTDTTGGSGGQAGGEGSSNILKILSKAHSEFCQTKGAGTAPQAQGDARAMGDNSWSPRRQGEGGPLYKPTPLKAGHDREEKMDVPPPVPHSGSLSVEVLFQTARQQDKAGDRPELPDVTKPSLLTRSTSVPDPSSGHYLKLPNVKSVAEVEALQIDPARQQGTGPDRDIGQLFSQAATRKVSKQTQQGQQAPQVQQAQQQPQQQQQWPQPLQQEQQRPPQQPQHTLQPQQPYHEEGWRVAPQPPQPFYDSGEPVPSFPSTDVGMETEDESLPRPEDFLSSTGPSRTPLMQDKLQVSGSAAETPDVLLSPLAFLGGPGSVPARGPSSVQVAAASQPASAVESDPEFSPLTKTQLQQALVYLIKNSPEFMDQIHSAYLKSVEQAMKGRKS